MSKRSWFLVIGIAFAIHNGEESLTAQDLLRFMQSEAPGFMSSLYAGITVSQLQANLIMITVLGFIVTALAVRFPASSYAFLMMVFAAVLGLNALLHIALAVNSWTYMPGLVTGLLITLPVSVIVLLRAKREAWVSTPAFWVVFPAAFLIHGPLLGMLLSASLLLMC